VPPVTSTYPSCTCKREEEEKSFFHFFILPPDTWGPCGSDIEREVKLYQTLLRISDPWWIQVNQGSIFTFSSGGALPNRALFSSEKISDFGTVAFSFVCDKYYLIMD